MKRSILIASTMCAAILLTAAWSVDAAVVSNLVVQARKGQVFITFTEVAGTSTTYQVFRATQPITSIAGLSPIATLPQGTGTNKYIGSNFIIDDLGSPLAAGKGLLVYTTTQGGTYYYAVTNSGDATLQAGINYLTGGIVETVAAVPGAVQIGPPVVNPEGNLQTPYFAWENYATWDPSWGYYGNRFNVVTQNPLAPGQQYPLTLSLHGAGDSTYHEPSSYAWPAVGVYIFPVDLAFIFGNTDPYTNRGRYHSKWFGYPPSSSSAIAINATEQRVIRYVNLIKADPRYQIDPTRVYVKGGSMGGGGAMHLAYHFPAVFAAAAPSIGWVSMAAWGDWSEFAPSAVVANTNGITLTSWEDMAWLSHNLQGTLPAMVHTFRKDDTIIPPTTYPGVLQQTETDHHCYVASWQNGGHTVFDLSGAADYKRFRLNEACPAFASASNSSAFSSQVGQRNLSLDWSSSLHDLFPSSSADAILDTPAVFAMTFKSLDVDATAQVVIRNAQSFRLAPNESVTWSNTLQASGQVVESGNATASSTGLVTLTIQIKTAGNRLTLTRTSGSTLPPSAPLNLRIIP